MTAAQAARIERLMARDRLVEVSITILENESAFRTQRAWRTLFRFYQDCACVPWPRWFKKRLNRPFKGKMRADRIGDFLHEAIPFWQ